MLRSILVFGCLIVAGCVTAPSARDRAASSEPVPMTRDVDADLGRAAVPASALVFAPRLENGGVPLELSRAERQPSAFIGYEGPVTEYYHVETYDRQSGGGAACGFGWGCGGGTGSSYGDRYERRVYIDKVGVLYR